MVRHLVEIQSQLVLMILCLNSVNEIQSQLACLALSRPFPYDTLSASDYYVCPGLTYQVPYDLLSASGFWIL